MALAGSLQFFEIKDIVQPEIPDCESVGSFPELPFGPSILPAYRKHIPFYMSYFLQFI